MNNFLRKIRILTIVSLLMLNVPTLLIAGENLLLNPDAETGDTQGWTDPDNIWGADAEVTPYEGSYFFWPSESGSPFTQMYQDIEISNLSDDIDAGKVYFHLSAWLRNWDQYPHDRATLAIEAISSNSNQLLYLSRHHRSPEWTFYNIEEQIPAGSRTLRVYLIATRFVGSDNDAYFDNISLEVDDNAPDVFITVTPEGGVTTFEVGNTLQLNGSSTGGVDSQYIWSSSFDAVATVDENGVVTGHKPGQAVIQAEGTSSHATGFLKINVYSDHSVIFEIPRENEKYTSGTTMPIRWSLKGRIDSGTLYYSTTGGGEWLEIGEISNLAAGTYSWVVPDTDTVQNNAILKMEWNDGESVSSIFTIAPAEDCFTQSDIDRAVEAAIIACQANPASCGIAPDTEPCIEVITYGKVPRVGCWVAFSTPCDVPEGWESTNEEPKDMCGVCDNTLPGSGDNCAVLESNFDITMPCIDVFGAKIAIKLQKYINDADPSWYYWKLILE